LLLTAGCEATTLLTQRRQPRKIFVDEVELPAKLTFRHPPGERPAEEILFDGKVGEAMPTFQHLDEAPAHKQPRRSPSYNFAIVYNSAACNRSTLSRQKTRNPFEGGALARPVRAEKSHHVAGLDLQGHTPEADDDSVIDDLEILDGKQRAICDVRRVPAATVLDLEAFSTTHRFVLRGCQGTLSVQGEMDA
jgi:hypothetical protein